MKRFVPPPARLVLSAAVFLACGDITWEPPADTEPVEGLTIRLLVPAEDSAVAAALGWGEERAVPGAQVWIERETAEGQLEIDPTDSLWHARSDSDGVVRFTDLEMSAYRIHAMRILEPEEVDRLPADRPLLRALAFATKSRPPAEFDLVLAPNRPGLLISEIYAFDKPGSAYTWNGFIEVYNNSDQTVYLDDRLIGRALSQSRTLSCSEILPYQNDQNGIWVRLAQRFPGGGGDYPLDPGETAVVAADAIDHRQVDPEFLDLRGADFEFRGNPDEDPDNPSVANMVDAGTRSAPLHGIQFIPGRAPPFLFGPVDISSLARDRPLQQVDDEFVRVPAGAISDAFSWIDGNPSSYNPICSPALNSTFDGIPLHVRWEPDSHLFSHNRRVVGTAPGGWTILMETGYSAVDFVLGPRTPGAVGQQHPPALSAYPGGAR